MFCPNCGKEIKEGFGFCPNCGNAVNNNSAANVNVAQSSASANQDDVLDLSDSFTSEDTKVANNNYASNNMATQNVASPVQNNYNATPNYNNPQQNNYNATPNYNNPQQNYYNGAQNYNNNYGYGPDKRRKPSIVGLIGAIVALVGCFLPIQQVASYSYSFMDINKMFGGGLSFEQQIVLMLPTIFIIACIVCIIFDIVGIKMLGRLAGLVNIAIIAFFLFSEVGGYRFADTFSSVPPGIGLILMIIGSIAMLISV